MAVGGGASIDSESNDSASGDSETESGDRQAASEREFRLIDVFIGYDFIENEEFISDGEPAGKFSYRD